IRLSPKDHYLGLWSEHVGRIYFELGNYDEAERWLAQAVAQSPNGPFHRAALAAFYADRGDTAAANAQVAKLKELRPTVQLADLVVWASGLCKQESERPRHLLAGLNKAMAGGNGY